MISMGTILYLVTAWGSWIEYSHYEDRYQCAAVEERMAQDNWYQKFDTVCVSFSAIEGMDEVFAQVEMKTMENTYMAKLK